MFGIAINGSCYNLVAYRYG